MKKKEVAHKEYKAAVEAGHGAYLMDQEKAVSDIQTLTKFLKKRKKSVFYSFVSGRFFQLHQVGISLSSKPF